MRDEFGTKLNVKPTAVCAVVEPTSLKKLGIVAFDVDCIPLPIITPAFLLARTAVYPRTVLYVGFVEGVITIEPL